MRLLRWLFLLTGCVLILSLCSDANTEKRPNKKIRTSPIAGIWYAGDKDVLKQDIESSLTQVKYTGRSDKPLAIISPHAGFRFSGQAAAYGFRLLQGRDIKRVIILAPAHTMYLEGISIPSYTHYETPLGEVPIDRDVADELLKNSLFKSIDEAHIKEHAEEMQIPFLQVVLKGFQIVPIIVGNVKLSDLEKAASLIRPFWDDNTIIIASSDFTHYGPNYNYIPFKEDIPSRLQGLDMEAAKRIRELDVGGFWKYKKDTGITICGFFPISLLLKLLPRDARSQILAYYRSGDILRDFSNSVSYISIAFFKPIIIPMKEEKLNIISKEDGRSLLALSRKVLIESVNKRHIIDDSILAGIKLSPLLKERHGVFVTLNKAHSLRGCIGNIEPIEPLYIGVIKNTVNAAFNDPRFKPVEPKELKDISIEISVLSKPIEIPSLREFLIGRDGIILKKGNRQAVFLPQVALEQGWDVYETMEHLSIKAGMDADGWKGNAQFFTFRSQIFDEGAKELIF